MEENKNNQQLVVEDNLPSKNNVPPSGVLCKMYMIHLGTVLSNISIASVILTFTTLLVLVASALFLPVYYVLLIFLTVITVGTIFITVPNFGSWWTKGAEMVSFFNGDGFKIMANAIPYFIAVAVLGSVVAMILLLLDKHNRNWVRIGICIAILVLAIVAILLLVLGVKSK